MEVFSCWLLILVFACKSIFQGLIMSYLDEDDHEQCFPCLFFFSFSPSYSSFFSLPSPFSPFLLLPLLLSFQGECHVSEEACNGRMKKTEVNVRQLRSMMAVKLWTNDLTSLWSSFLIKMTNGLLNANPSWIYEFMLWARKHQASPFLSSCGYGFSRICFYSHLRFLVIAVVQLRSRVTLFATPWTAAR